jgi:hypothetical protein
LNLEHKNLGELQRGGTMASAREHCVGVIQKVLVSPCTPMETSTSWVQLK